MVAYAGIFLALVGSRSSRLADWVLVIVFAYVEEVQAYAIDIHKHLTSAWSWFRYVMR